MAYLVGRFCQAYPAYTAEAALAMPAVRFFALSGVIRRLEAEDDLRALQVSGIGANPGEGGKAFRDYSRQLQRTAGREQQGKVTTVVPGVTPLTMFEAEAGEIERERERQREADARLRAAYEKRAGGT